MVLNELLKFSLAPRKLVVDINNWLATRPDLDYIIQRATSDEDVPTPQAFVTGFAGRIACLEDGSGSLALSIIAALTNKVMDETPRFLRPQDLAISRTMVTTWMNFEKTYISYVY